MHIKSILFISPYPNNEAPSQRFRFEQYLHLLGQYKITYHQTPLLSKRGWSIFYKDGKPLLKFYYLTIGCIRRFLVLLKLNKYEYIFIHREAFPVGPPLFEWLISRLFKKKIIYDFDDAIWLNDPEEEGTLKSKLKWKCKVRSICKLSHTISTGNEYLASYAKAFNPNVRIIPTTINTENLHNLNLYQSEIINKTKPVIGWTGTHSTLQYLDQIIPIIEKLENKYEFDFLVIANKRPSFNLKSLKFVYWSKSDEIKQLLKIDIGIMPLTDDKWSLGKCGFKALQYMALEIPALVSPVGINKKIVSHQKNGFHCYTNSDWENYLIYLLENNAKIREMGKNGRLYVEKHYSMKSNTNKFISLFQ